MTQRAGALLLAAFMAALITYGSLYPFRFRAWPGDTALLEAMMAALRRPPGGRGDIVANLLLYAPLGMALAAAAAAQWGRIVALLLGLLGCALLSLALEFTQILIPGRTASGWDVLLNAVGGGLGAAAALLLGPGRIGLEPAWRRAPLDASAALLLACWLAYRLYPFLPALDLGEWRASLRPLLAGAVDPWRALRLAVLWVVAARLAEAAWPGRAARWLFGAIMLGTPLAAIPIVGRSLTPAELLAVGIALPAWLLLRRHRALDFALLTALVAVVLTEGAAPFRLLGEARPFGWIPFRSLLRGSWEAGALAMLLKFFLYGTVLWLAVRCGMRLWLATLLTAILALSISTLQTWLPGRSAEITDSVLVFGAAVMLRILPRGKKGDWLKQPDVDPHHPRPS